MKKRVEQISQTECNKSAVMKIENQPSRNSFRDGQKMSLKIQKIYI